MSYVHMHTTLGLTVQCADDSVSVCIKYKSLHE